jgi:hypothetical protein
VKSANVRLLLLTNGAMFLVNAPKLKLFGTSFLIFLEFPAAVSQLLNNRLICSARGAVR